MRLRILELPMETVGELTTTPFLLVIDQVEKAELKALGGEVVQTKILDEIDAPRLAEETGARAVLVFAQDVDFD